MNIYRVINRGRNVILVAAASAKEAREVAVRCKHGRHIANLRADEITEMILQNLTRSWEERQSIQNIVERKTEGVLVRIKEPNVHWILRTIQEDGQIGAKIYQFSQARRRSSDGRATVS